MITPGDCEVRLSNYKYQTIDICNNLVALNIATNQINFNVLVRIFNTRFNHLNNSGVLKYHAESCGTLVHSILSFINCSIEHNQGNKYLKLFYMVVSDCDICRESFDNDECGKRKNIINFRLCAFINYTNMKSVLYILLQNSLSANVLINIRDSIFVNNHKTRIIKINSKLEVLWQLTHYMILMNIRLISNSFGHRGSLISSENGFIKFLNSVIIRNNTYKATIHLYFSVLRFQGYSEFSANDVYYILDLKGGSYNILKEHSVTKHHHELSLFCHNIRHYIE